MAITYDAAFDLWVRVDTALEAIKATKCPKLRKRWLCEGRRARNTAYPATRRAAVEARGEIIREGRRWFQQQGSFDANISDCIQHLQVTRIGIRVCRETGRTHQIGPSQMRKILKDAFGIEGRPGKPKR